MNHVKAPYPVDSLPPLLNEVVKELGIHSNVPPELAAPLVLGVASLACQGAVDVARPNCEPSPTLLYTFVISGSGSRKTAVLLKLLLPIAELEQELADEAAKRMPEFEAALLAWEVKKKYLLSQIERKAKKNEASDQLQEQLTLHMGARPLQPTAPKFIYEDPTAEAVVNGLCKTWHSAAVISSEGGGFLNGRPAYDLPMWNKLWDGAGIGVERIGRGSISARDARGSLIIAIQEGQFEEFRDSRGAQAMDIGFLGRGLFSRPPQNIGTRFIYPGQQASNWECLKRFQARAKSLLRSQVEDFAKGNVLRTVLEFSLEAERRWVEAFNIIESMIQPGGQYNAIPGYASKIPETAARIAAIFHHIQGKEGPIQYSDVQNALRICEWHANEFLDCFGPPAKVPLEFRDAECLEKWLLDFVWNVSQSEVRKNDVRQSGPNQLRNKIRLDNALRVLMGYNRLRVILSSNKTRIVQLNHDYFSRFTFTNRANF